MKRRFVLCLTVVALALSGCRHYSNPGMEQTLVTKILITAETENGSIRRYYDSPEKMRQVLLYIRSVQRGFETKEDPTALPGRSICITTFSVDDTKKVYRQKCDLYFQTDAGVWQDLDPEKAQSIWDLLYRLPSDPETPRNSTASLPFFPQFVGRNLPEEKRKKFVVFLKKVLDISDTMRYNGEAVWDTRTHKTNLLL